MNDHQLKGIASLLEKYLHAAPGEDQAQILKAAITEAFLAGQEQEQWRETDHELPPERVHVLVQNEEGSMDVSIMLNKKWLTRVGQVKKWKYISK